MVTTASTPGRAESRVFCVGARVQAFGPAFTAYPGVLAGSEAAGTQSDTPYGMLALQVGTVAPMPQCPPP